MAAALPVYCARCQDLAVVRVDAGTPDTERRSATACDRHTRAVRRWAAHVGTPRTTSINQTPLGQLALFPEVNP
jgi:hypothetical protein